MIKRIILENTGPIELFDYEFSDFNNRKKPLILVGENGSGKSIALSFIVNSLLSAKQVIYDNVEIEKGKVYKIRSSGYIRNNTNFYFGKILFENGFECVEFQLDRTKQEFENSLKYTPVHREWNSIPNHEFSLFAPNYNSDTQKLRSFLTQNTFLYFPPNRFEEPAWLNTTSIKNAEFSNELRLSNLSNRQIICNTTLSSTKNWLLEVLFDSRVLERKNFPIEHLARQNQVPNPAVQAEIMAHILGGGKYEGKNTNLINIVNNFLRILFQDNASYRIGVGDKNNRTISIMRNEKSFVLDLHYLSTGEALILSLFCSILRDYDKTNLPLNSTNDIKGIVLIDEIDLHLHTKLQYNLLPKLISQFPNVQFIITTHSPLFLAGMEGDISKDGFDIINLPQGRKINTEYYSEFESVYTIIQHSQRFATEINNAITNSKKPILFVEGDYDIEYLNKAAELLDRKDILEKFEIKDSVGYGNIDKVWKHFDSKLSEITSQKIILLYDCDTNKTDANKGNVYKLLIPSVSTNPIEKGIENLFTKETIQKAIEYKQDLIDITPSYVKKIRGENVNVEEKWEANRDEKRNLCDWICANCVKDDFTEFETVFNLLHEIMKK
jgi:predicted ATP-binding protein involved in virulence